MSIYLLFVCEQTSITTMLLSSLPFCLGHQPFLKQWQGCIACSILTDRQRKGKKRKEKKNTCVLWNQDTLCVKYYTSLKNFVYSHKFTNSLLKLSMTTESTNVKTTAFFKMKVERTLGIYVSCSLFRQKHWL